MIFRHFAVATVLLSSTAGAADWGSFDSSRINYSNGVFTTGSYTDLRAKIQNAGGTIAPATSILTAQYLDSVDVFFTSALNVTTGVLSNPEQAALIEWVKCGGTLIVSAEYSTISGNDSFLKPFGITTAASGNPPGAAVPTTSHPLLTNVTSLNYAADAVLTLSSGVQILMKNPDSNAFAAVVDDTPEVGIGRVFAMGDHGPFTDGGSSSASQFRQNLVQWADTPLPCPNATASWGNYGAGWPGTLGVPFLGLDNAPVIGEEFTMALKTNQANSTQALFIFGSSPLNLPSALGGSLLVVPKIQILVPMPEFGLSIAAPVDCTTNLCGQSIFMQALVVDQAASHGVAFTRGMQLTFGS